MKALMVKPMLTTLVKEPFDDPDWVFETKWDGFRALVKKGKRVEIFSRNGHLLNHRFPHLVKAFEKIQGAFLVDGEIVVFDRKNISRFQLLQKAAGKATFMAFDLLSLRGKDLTKQPLLKRKSQLQTLIGKRKEISLSKHIERYGKKLFSTAIKKGWEGIIAKRKAAPYVGKRTRDWLKIKTKMRQEVVIGGFTKARGSRPHFGALLIGVYKRGELIYAGHVGTGFNRATLKALHKKMVRLKREMCPFAQEPKANDVVTWIQPKLVCEVAFTEWTKEGMLRQPAFLGLRSDKSAKSVRRENVS